MRCEEIMLSDVNGEVFSVCVSLFTKNEIIKYMRDKDTSKYGMELYTPHCYKYSEALLRDDELYFIYNKEVTLYLI